MNFQLTISGSYKKYYTLVYIICFFFVAVPSRGQFNYNAILPPSPTASSLGKYGDIPISLYTGTPNISVPFPGIKGSELELPISLSYMARGIKVEENASWVGTGWSLSCAGVITRTVRGLEDGSRPRVAFPISTDIVDTHELMQDIVGLSLDPEPDLYFFNFPGYSGSFVLDENGEAVLGDYKELRIKHDPDNFFVFTITTENGTQYIFDKPENTSFSSSLTTGSTSAMYLSKIISPTRKETIEFLYQDEMTKYFSTARPKKWVRPPNFVTPENPVAGFGTTVINGVRLHKIITNFGQQVEFVPSPDVRQDLAPVDPSIAPRALQEIQFSDDNDVIKRRFVFEYETLETSIPYVRRGAGDPPADQTTAYANYRLYLKSVTEVTPDLSRRIPPHAFLYFGRNGQNKDLLPSKLSAAQDHWGYYNGVTSNIDLWPGYSGPFGGFDWRLNIPFLCASFSLSLPSYTVPGADREPHYPFMLYGTLTRIIYPTGGKTAFEFEPHRIGYDMDKGGASTKITQVVSQVYLSGAGTELETTAGLDVVPLPANHFSFEFKVTCWDPNSREPMPCDAPGAQVNFDKYQGNGVSLFSPDNVEIIAAKWIPGDGGFWIYRGGMVDMQIGRLMPDSEGYITKDIENVPVAGGAEYILKATKDPDSDTDVFGWFYYSKEVVIEEESELPLGGGIRVSRIENFNEQNVSVGLKTYKYGLGVLLDGPRYSTYTFRTKEGTPTWFQKCATHLGEDPNVYMEISCGSHSALGYTQGSSIGYRTVTEKHNGNGSIEYEYTTGVEYPDNNDNASNVVTMLFFQGDPRYDEKLDLTITGGKPAWPFIAQDNLDRKRGFLKSIVHKNEAGQPLKTIEYHPLMVDLKTVGGVRVLPLRPDIDWMFSTYKYSSGFVNIASTSETETYFGETSSEISKTTGYFYQSPHHKFLTKKEAFESEANTLTLTEYRYPDDYDNITNSEHVITQMKSDNLHMTGKPIETRTYRNQILVDGSVNVPAKYPNGEGTEFFVAPKETRSLRDGTNAASWSTDPTNPDAASFTKDAEFNFGEDGNLISVAPQNGVNIAFLWEDGNPNPVAKAINASPDRIFFTSFETNGTEGSRDDAKTGKKYWNTGTYNFSANSAFTPDNPGSLKMSYWHWSAANGWQFSGEVNFSNTISTSSSRLDEIRVFPAGSQMTTYTYDPFVGMLSQTDTNNVTQHFKYDKYGRLEVIEDDKSNIIKKYTYHYSGE